MRRRSSYRGRDQTVLVAIGLIVLGLALLYVGAELLVKGAVALALSAGLTPMAVGLTVVAYGTSAPEMVVSSAAALNSKGGIAVGNVVGSNICNIGIVLGVSALCCPLMVKREMIRIHVPLMIFGGLLLTSFLADGLLDRLEGLVLVVGIVGYSWMNISMARKQTLSEPVDEIDGEITTDLVKQGSIWLDIVVLLAGLGILIGGGHVLVEGATSMARRMGVSDAVIGLTVVALGTSAPDLAASVVAALRKHADMAVGNAVGSVMFNLMQVTGVAALIRPIQSTGVDPVDYAVQMGMLILAAIVMRTGMVIQRWEGGLCFAAYIGYIIYRWPA